MAVFTPDTRIAGRYRLTHQLGSGGMGTVWAGRDERLGRDVAVKELVPPAELTEEQREELRERTLREARAAARINSTAAVTVYDVVEEDGRPWIVMERLVARTLAEIVRADGPLDPDRVAQIGLRLVDALQAAHTAGVLHRDVKPANVMMTSHGKAVLTDFGIATLDGDPSLTTTGMLVGSPAYISPERARGENATGAADLWSLGATLYTAVEGRTPFERQGQLPTLTAVLTEPPHPMHRAGALGPVLEALLDKDPQARPDLQETRAMLRAALWSSSPVAVPGRAGSTVDREADRTRSFRAARPVAAAAVAAAAPSPAAAAVPAPAETDPAPAPSADPPAAEPPRRRRPVVIAIAAVGTLVLLLALAGGSLLIERDGTGPSPEAGENGEAGEQVPADEQGDEAAGDPGQPADPGQPGGEEPEGPEAALPEESEATEEPDGQSETAEQPDGQDDSTLGPVARAAQRAQVRAESAQDSTTEESPEPQSSEPADSEESEPEAQPTQAQPTEPEPTEPTEPEPTEPTEPEDPPGGEPPGVPDGFRLHEDPTGFSVLVPEDWQTTRESSYVDFQAPQGGPFLRVDQTDTPAADPVEDWLQQEEGVSQRLDGYERIRIDPLEFRGWEAADWEFTWDTSSGNQIHVLNRNLVIGPDLAHALYWSVPEAQWEQSRGTFRVISQSFQPAS